MKTTASCRFRTLAPGCRERPAGGAETSLCVITFLLSVVGAAARPARAEPSPHLDPGLLREKDEASGTLTLRTAYYTIAQDLEAGRRVPESH